MTRAQQARSGRRGAVALEFAIVGLAVLMVLLGIIEFALQSAVGALLESAAREASRFGITGRTVPDGMEADPPKDREEAIRRIILRRGASFLKNERLTIKLEAFDDMIELGKGGEGKAGAGGAEQIVVYDLEYRQPLLVEMFVPVLELSELLHTTTVIVKNEPETSR